MLRPLPPYWEESKTASGLIYYKNTRTNATTWDRPVPQKNTAHSAQPVAIRDQNVRSSATLGVCSRDRTADTFPPPTSVSITSSRSTSTSPLPRHQSQVPGSLQSLSISTPPVGPRTVSTNPFVRTKTPPNPPKPRIHVTRPIHQSETVHNKTDGREYIIGIDFGTTFSSCCYYARASEKAPFRKEGVQQITQWAGQGALENIPSQILYEGQRVIAWGEMPESESFDRPNSLLVKWFKLHLKRSSELISGPYNEGLQSSRIFYPLPAGMKAGAVVTDYLKRLRLEILESLRRMKADIAGCAISWM